MELNYVRVKVNDLGDHWTVLQQEYDANPDAYTLLKQPAINLNGDPLPATPAESLSSKSEGQKATDTTNKEK